MGDEIHGLLAPWPAVHDIPQKKHARLRTTTHRVFRYRREKRL
jgi:hypothetical protein